MTDNSQNNSACFRLLRAGALQLAVADEHVTAITGWTEPAPLPFATKAVLGVVCIQGRMFTVLDLAQLMRPDEIDEKTSPRLILALRGDEQLALAVDTAEEPIDAQAVSITQSESPANDLIRESIEHEGGHWQILNVDELFHSLVQGRDRRRRRF